MDLVQTILSSIPSEQLTAIRSRVLAPGIRRVPVSLTAAFALPTTCGVDLRLSVGIRGHISISHVEIASVLGKTVAEVAAMTADEVEATAPFLTPALTKLQSILADAGAEWSALFPLSPWAPPAPTPTPEPDPAPES